MKNPIVILLIAILISGCGAIQKHRNIEQSIGIKQTTGIGGTIFRLNKTSDLPNVFGKRDIYGGKIDKGYAEMKLVGIDGAKIKLQIIDANKTSSETVMERYNIAGRRNAFVNVEVENNFNNNDPENAIQAIPYIINFDTNKQKDIVISGVRVIFTNVKTYSIQYILEDSGY